jgi:hypothetical protein
MSTNLFLTSINDLVFTSTYFPLFFDSIHFEFLLAPYFSHILALNSHFIDFLTYFIGHHYLFAFGFDKSQNLNFFLKVYYNRLRIFIFNLSVLIKNHLYGFIYFFLVHYFLLLTYPIRQ